MLKLIKIASNMLEGKVKKTYKITLLESQKAVLKDIMAEYNHPFHHVLINYINEEKNKLPQSGEKDSRLI
jgi:hypothetical protein